MFPDHIKRFVIESNKEKAVKREFEMRRNQDLKKMPEEGGNMTIKDG